MTKKNGGKGGSPGTPTPGWDKDWPPKAPQKPKPGSNIRLAGKKIWVNSPNEA